MVCSGVGTPRIMPNSNSKEFPDDIANRHGQLEKNLMFYPLSGVVGLFEEPMEDFKGPMACGIVSQEFCEVDLSRDFVRGYSLHGGRFTTSMTFALGSEHRQQIRRNLSLLRRADYRYRGSTFTE